MDEVRIRDARPDEMEAVARLRWRGVLETDGAVDGEEGEYVRSFTAWAASHHDHHCTVVVRGETIVGMAWLAVGTRVPTPRSFERTSGDIQSVYVIPPERNAGIGGRLLKAVVARADELGLQHVTVHSSPRAVTAYRRVGFVTSERYLHRNKDAAADSTR
jgi:GNAT superfamily N-acetyltransferase